VAYDSLIGGIISALIVNWFINTIVMVVLPLMWGGMRLGGVPMLQVYAYTLGNDPSYYISLVVPAIALGNLFAIVRASVLNGLGKKFPSLTGNGVMIPGFEYGKEDKSINYSVSKLGIGLIVGLLALTLATIISNVIPLHPFALMILMIAILKLTNTLPKVLVDAAVA